MLFRLEVNWFYEKTTPYTDMISENINTINTISEFLLKPTSKNFIKIFKYVRTQKEINWQIYEKDIEKKLNIFIFDHENYQDFTEDLWNELSCTIFGTPSLSLPKRKV